MKPPYKGRGAIGNPDGRYNEYRYESVDDGWHGEGEEPPPRTEVSFEHPRTVIARNDSPDIPFDRAVNPYRGCEHGCIYCLSGDTPILMADGSTRKLETLRPGDEIYGTQRHGWYRRYVKTRVLAHWQTYKPAFLVLLKDGTKLVASGDHRFLTDRGWKYVTGGNRPFLTPNNKLMGVGAFSPPPQMTEDYRRGYVTGMIRGDGHLATYFYPRTGRRHGNQYQFRLALTDTEALGRTRHFLSRFGITTPRFAFRQQTQAIHSMEGIRTHARHQVEAITTLVQWPQRPSPDWCRGFLAGIFDAEGSYSTGTLRITNQDATIIAHITHALESLGFTFTVKRRERLQVVRLLGGLTFHLRFFHTTAPAISRKCLIAGQAVKSSAALDVVSITPLGKTLPMFDITTGTGDFIANGVISHNCYARPSHAWLGLSPGLDFETKLTAKPDAAERLRRELQDPGYRPAPIALGANTDPYQPIERRFRITRRILEVLREFDHPCTITTKSSLVERDLDLIAPMAERDLVRVHVSLTTLQPPLAHKLEPRACAPRRRLQTIARLREAGVPVTVMVAPVIPVLTDAELETVLKAAADAGATHAGYVLVRLPQEVADLFADWLQVHFPDRAAHVMNRIRDCRGGRADDPRFGHRMRGQGVFADLIAQRFRIAVRRLGLDRPLPPLDTGRFRGAPRQLTLF